MTVSVGAPVSERATARAKTHFSLQEWLDTEASKYAWAVTFLSSAARASSFYSGGALSLPRLLGPGGMAVFDDASGLGIAFGAEMLASIAGRAWRRNKRLAREALSLPNMKRSDRENLRAQYLETAAIDFAGFCLGVFGTVCAAFAFLFNANADHSIATILGEVLVTVLLVGVTTYLGVFNTTPRTDPGQSAQAQAIEIRGAVTDAAGSRIAGGIYSPDDVYTVASQLPRGDREQFIAALVRPEQDDPIWGTRDMCAFLGVDALPSEQDEQAAKRRLTRLLAKLAKEDVRIQKSDKGAYQVPRSLAIMYLADMFQEIQRASLRRTSDARASQTSQPEWLKRLVGVSDTPQDGSQASARPDARQEADTSAAVS